MAHRSFTRAQAQAKIGRRVRPRIPFAAIPEGAVGTIIRVEQVIDGHDVEVAWLWSGRRTPWIDWLTKAEYEACLTELA